MLSCQNLDVKASIEDISERGVRIKISGKPPIIIGDVLKLTVSDHSMAAKVMWVKKLSDGAIAGLQKVQEVL